jgi:hypothetical protein
MRNRGGENVVEASKQRVGRRAYVGGSTKERSALRTGGEDAGCTHGGGAEVPGLRSLSQGTQAVFGELEGGDTTARKRVSIMMIGEQPGDKEDLEGRPFVGPAGKLLDKCLEEAGIDRRRVYVTNTVKHFNWAPRGKLRIQEAQYAVRGTFDLLCYHSILRFRHATEQSG